MGLTLTAASVAVFYSLDFSYANYEQSRARNPPNRTEDDVFVYPSGMQRNGGRKDNASLKA